MTDEILLHGMPEAVLALSADESVRAIIITGAGGAFCSGADLSCSGLAQPSAAASRSYMGLSHRTVLAIRQAPKMVIAAIEGAAVGAGLALATVCDYRVAAPTATFIAPFLNMGIPPDFGSTYIMPRAIGPDRALELFITARPVTADEALRIGLISAIADDPLPAARELATKAAALAPGAVAATKRNVYASMDRGMEEAVLSVEIPSTSIALHSEEFKEYFAAYMARMQKK
jgi:enoyl-CoA hydratase/carnithine racemase